MIGNQRKEIAKAGDRQYVNEGTNYNMQNLGLAWGHGLTYRVPA
jgi:hypothetical protein